MRKLRTEIWPYRITTKIGNPSTDNDIDLWCRKVLGMRFRDWYSYDVLNGREFAFKDSESLMLFKLTWGYGDGIKKNN